MSRKAILISEGVGMDKGSPVGTQGIIVEGLVFSQTMEWLQNDFIDKNIVSGSRMPGTLGIAGLH